MDAERLQRVLAAVDAADGVFRGFIGHKVPRSDAGIVIHRWILVITPECRRKHKITLRDVRAAISGGYISLAGNNRYVLTESGYATTSSESSP